MTTYEPTDEGKEPAGVSQDRAIVFADLAGTTAVAATIGDLALAALLQAFFQRVDHFLRLYRGRVIKTLGDGFLALFEHAPEALQFAIALQQSLATEPLVAGHRVLLTVSLHVGAVTVVKTSYGDDAFGSNINIAARLEGQARPGQVVVSDAACRVLSPEQQGRLGPPENVDVTRPRAGSQSDQIVFRRLTVVET
jgi:class 3 adenylate cyclase